jgi:hypothetical protein
LNELDPRGRLERRVQISVCSFPGQGHKNKRVRGLSAEASHRISNLRRSDVCQIAQARLAIDGLSERIRARHNDRSLIHHTVRARGRGSNDTSEYREQNIDGAVMVVLNHSEDNGNG